MTTKAESFLHISGPKAVALAAAINGTNSADVLCRSGFSYPVAIALSHMMAVGVGDVGALHRSGFSASDSVAIAAGISARGVH